MKLLNRIGSLFNSSSLSGSTKSTNKIKYLLLMMLLGTSSYAMGENLTLVTYYGKTGGITGDGSLNAVGNTVNGVNICPGTNTNANSVPGCDMSFDPGYQKNDINDPTDDTYTGDLIVRTNDQFQVFVGWGINGGHEPVTITSTLPSNTLKWVEPLPSGCGAGSSVSTDGLTLVCVRSGYNSGNSYAEDIPFNVIVKGSTANNTQPGDISVTVSSDNSAPKQDDIGASIIVTASPRWNIQKSLYTYAFGQTVNGQVGAILEYKYYLEVDEVSGATDTTSAVLGNESLGPDFTLEFDDDLSRVSPNAELVNCRKDRQNTNDPYAYYNATYPERSAATPLATMVQTCTQAAPGANIHVKHEHIDATLEHIPTFTYVGYTIPATRAIAAIGTIRVFIPDSDIATGINATDTTGANELKTKNVITSFDPVSISGQSNFGALSESTVDNSYARTLFGTYGSFGKHYTTNLARWWESAAGGGTGYRAGDGVVTPGAKWTSRVNYYSSGSSTLTNGIVCDIFDSNTVDVTDIPSTPGQAITIHYSNGGTDAITGAVYEYATGYVGGTWPPNPNANPSNRVAQECGDAGITWYPTTTAAKAVGPITKIRVRFTNGIPTGTNSYTIINLTARSNDLNGNPITSGTIIPNYASVTDDNYFNAARYPATNGWYPTSYQPKSSYNEPHSGYGGDRILLVRAKARISKELSLTNVTTGNVVDVTLKPTFTCDGSTVETAPVKLTEMLDLGLNYKTGSSTNPPGEPVIGTCADLEAGSLKNSCTTSNTVLVWDLGNKSCNSPIPPLVYQLEVDAGAPIGTLHTYTMVSSPTDTSPLTIRTANKNLEVSIPFSLIVTKSIDDSYYDIGEQLHFTVNVRNGTVNPLSNMDVIDILPFNGDGINGYKFTVGNSTTTETRSPGTDYDGTTSFSSASLGAGCIGAPAFFYSNSVPSAIDISPTASSNNGGATNWCAGTAAGPGAGCGFGNSAVTAVRVTGVDLSPSAICKVDLTLDTSGMTITREQRFSNTAGAFAQGVSLPTVSNLVTIAGYQPVTLDDVKSNPNPIAPNNPTTIDILNNDSHPSNPVSIVDSTVDFDPTSVPNGVGTDTDGDGDIDKVVVPNEGTWTVGNNGTVVFTPVAEFIGDPSPLSYIVMSDNGFKSAPATITVSYFQPPVSDISGKVEADTNNDNNPDIPLAGVSVMIYQTDGVTPATHLDGTPFVAITTGGDGSYKFVDVPAGDYIIKETNPANYDSISDIQGANDDSIAVTSPAVPAPVIGQDFIDTPVRNISGKVEEDTSNNNIADGPLNNVVVTLYEADGTTIATDAAGNDIPAVHTNSDGTYSFTNVPTGNYVVKETTPATHASVSDTNGANDDTIAVDITVADSTGNYFLDAPLGSISGKVEADTNNDNTADSPISNVTLTLYKADGTTAATDAAGNPIPPVQTDGNGHYIFENVPAGDYVVKETNPASYISYSDVDGANDDAITASVPPTGGAVTAKDFIDVPVSNISGKVETDSNNDNTGDAPLAGVVVTLYKADGVTIATDVAGNPIQAATTNGSGNYSFSNVPAGDYIIKEANPEAYASISDVQGVNDDTISVTSPAVPAPVTGQDFVDAAVRTISGKVEEDTSNSYTANGPLASVLVTLYEADGTTVATNAEGIAIPAVNTNPDGTYSFTNVPAGNYVVKETTPASYASVSDTNGDNDDTIAVDIIAADSTGNNFLDAPLGSISGKVEADTDNDNTVDSPLSNVTVTLFKADGMTPATDAAGNPIPSVQTDGDGNYIFEAIPAGNYVVKETNPASYASYSDVGGVNDDAIAVSVPPTGGAITGKDFADVPVSNISGTVEADTNNDNVADAPLNNVEITLYEADGATIATDATGNPIAPVKTNADGNYSFSNVPAGNYVIKETNLDSYDSISDIVGANDDTVSVTSPAIPASVAGQDFVDAPVRNITGKVEEDTNNDNAGDNPLSGIKVTLYEANGTTPATDAAGNVIPAVDTNPDGSYSFANVPAGNYVVKETTPATHASISDIDGANDDTIVVNILLADSSGNDFLDARITGLSGKVRADTNKDGIGDTPIAGVTITLFEADGVTPATDAAGNPIPVVVTKSDGSYSFANVPAGDYIIKESNPEKYHSVADIQGANDDTIAVNVPANGATVIGQDFVDAPVSDISGTVKADTNNDNASDTPLGAVTLTLYEADGSTPATDAAGNLIPPVITESDGSYIFTEVPAGDYVIKESNPVDYDSISDIQGANDDSIVVTSPATPSQVTGQDFIDTPVRTISGQVQEDTDNDNEPNAPLAGATVTLYEADGITPATNANGDVITAIVTTDGTYSFTHVPAGNYVVKESNPETHHSISDTDGDNDDVISVDVSTADSLDNDFLDAPISGISGTVKADTDNNNEGDTGIEGITLTLYEEDGVTTATNAAGEPILAVVTDSDGAYTFVDVPAGNYVIKETNLEEYHSVSDVDDSNDDTISVSVPKGGVSVTGQDFVDAPVSDISGTVKADVNNDNATDVPLSDVMLTLYESDGTTPATNANGDPIKPVKTDSEGNYTFVNVPAGEYVIKETNPVNYASISDVDGENDDLIKVTSPAKPSKVEGQNFVDTPLRTISGQVQKDTNNDQEPDGPIIGVLVSLFESDGVTPATYANGAPIEPVSTDSDGKYMFINIPAGVYVIKETNPEYFKSISDTDGDNDDSIVANVLGESSTGNNFLDQPLGNLEGIVYEDTNGNGKQDANEPGIAGVKVIVTDSNEIIHELVTDEEGKYNVVVPSGETLVDITESDVGENYKQTEGTDPTNIIVPAAGTGKDIDGFAPPQPPVAVDDKKEDQKLGQPVTVSTVSNDSDPDNNLDPTTVMLVDPSGNPVKLLTVEGEGVWTVDPETGDITFTPEIGFVGDPKPVKYTVKDTTGLESNQATVTLEFEEPAALEGTVWLDRNKDGVIDPNEERKAGWTLKIKDKDGNVIATTVTDEQGNYSVTGLIPQEYTIEFFNPNGVLITTQSTDGPLKSGETVNLPLPVDPSGVLYDSTTRVPLGNVRLQLVNTQGTPINAACLGEGQQNQLTADDGLYAFDVIPGAHATCVDGDRYHIRVVSAPTGYFSDSIIIPPKTGVYSGANTEQGCTIDRIPNSGSCEIQQQVDAPQGTQDTTYFMDFILHSNDLNIIFNNIPLDSESSRHPELADDAVLLSKSANKKQASVADQVYYTIHAENTTDEVLSIDIRDDLPTGFKFTAKSASLIRAGSDGRFGTADDIKSTINATGYDPVRFGEIKLNPAEKVQVGYLLKLGSGVRQGNAVNSAQVYATGSTTDIASNIATATVVVVPDTVLNQSSLIGKVFHDRDSDGYQDNADASAITIRSGKWVKHIGTIHGRISVLDDPAKHRKTIRVPATGASQIRVTTKEGTVITIDKHGQQRNSHRGPKAKNLTAQDLRVSTRRVGNSTDITITNYGIHEEGIPGVRLVSVGGLLIETDGYGRYHIPDVDSGRRNQGKNFILKVDPATLPDGARFTTENPRVLRITGTALNKINFGVRLPVQKAAQPGSILPRKRILVTLDNSFFDTGRSSISANQAQAINMIAASIRKYGNATLLIDQSHISSLLAKQRVNKVRHELNKKLSLKLMSNVTVKTNR